MAWEPLPPEPPAVGWWTELAERQAEADLDRWVERRAAEKRARRDAARPRWSAAELGALAEARIRRVDDALYDPYARRVPVGDRSLDREVEYRGGGEILDVR